VTQGATTVATYAYDALGHRKSKTVGTTTTIYVRDPGNRALLDYDGTSGAVGNWYAFGAGLNDALNQVNLAASTRATFIPDIQGSVIGSLDANSGIITKAGYQPYGESGSTAGTFRYTGARIDAETNGLYDFRARMYSPVLGRFMQVDPVGIRGGMNLYGYVGNDPLNALDPTGLTEANNQIAPLGANTLDINSSGQPLAQSGSVVNDETAPPINYFTNASWQIGPGLVGQDAHQVILNWLQSGPNGALWSGNTTFGGLFGSGRPDLIYGLDPMEVFEIKPAESVAAGAIQLQGYLNTAGGTAAAGSFSSIFNGAPSLTLESSWFFGRTTYTFAPSQYPGVVGYTVNNRSVFEDIAQAFRQRPSGAPSPLPLPAPIPIVP
jgi:RHS repeat-associated protein